LKHKTRQTGGAIIQVVTFASAAQYQQPGLSVGMEKGGGPRNCENVDKLGRRDVIPLASGYVLQGQVAELREKLSISPRVSLLLLGHNACMLLNATLLGSVGGWTAEEYV
jgi:hypothetical protein